METLVRSGASTPSPVEAWLAVWGMYCPDCEARVADALQRLHGVLDVEVDWVCMGARVVIAPGEVRVDGLIACVVGVNTNADYLFWASSGPEVSRALRGAWELKSLGSHTNGPISTSKALAHSV